MKDDTIPILLGEPVNLEQKLAALKLFFDSSDSGSAIKQIDLRIQDKVYVQYEVK